MQKTNTPAHKLMLCGAAALFLASACSRPKTPEGVSVMPSGKQFSGYLTDYSKLMPNTKFENTVSYVRDDPMKNIHKYVAVIVEPVAIYVATGDASRAMPCRRMTTKSSPTCSAPTARFTTSTRCPSSFRS